MKYVYTTLLALLILEVGILIGSLWPQVVTPNEKEMSRYTTSRCDDIVRDHNGRLVCEITLSAEDEAQFTGARFPTNSSNVNPQKTEDGKAIQ